MPERTDRFDQVPPILHFSKHKKGEVTFNGLCVLRDLEEAWFDDGGVRVRNYRAVLETLAIEEVSVAWLHQRRDRQPESAAPDVWKTYARTGEHTRLRAYVSRLKPRVDQLPAHGSDEWRRLERLHAMDPIAFERFTVSMFSRLSVAHRIVGTRAVADGGFDFHGSFKLPPVGYSVNFKGECKRYRPSLTGSNGVGPKDVAQLVARLQRGEHGLFVTTTYYTRACQEEVYADEYPVELISGGQLVGMAAQIGMRVA